MDGFELEDFDLMILNYINSLLKINNIKISRKQEKNRLEAIKLLYKAKLLSEEASYVVSNYDFERLYLLSIRQLVNELEGLTMKQVKEENLSKLDIIKKIIYNERADVIPLEIFELIVSRLDIESIKNLAIAMGFKLTNKYLNILEKIRSYNIKKTPGTEDFIKEAITNASMKGDFNVIKYFVDGNYYNDYNTLLKEYKPKNDIDYSEFIRHMRRRTNDKIKYPENMTNMILKNDYIESFKVFYQLDINFKVFMSYSAYLNSIQILRYLVKILENMRKKISSDDFKSLYGNAYNDAFLYTCFSESHDTFNFLLDISDINYQDSKTGKNALMIVCEQRDEEKLTKLLDVESLNMNLQDNNGNTALMNSFSVIGRKRIFDILKFGSSDIITIVNRVVSVKINVNERAFKIIQLLLTRNDIDVNIKNNYGDTSLIKSAKNLEDRMQFEDGQIDNIISPLLLNNKNIDVTLSNNNGENALMLFSKNKYGKVSVKKILNIDNTIVNEQNNKGETALIQAVNNRHEEIVDELLKVDGIDINIQDNSGFTALISAVIMYNDKNITMKLLKRSDVNIDILDFDGYNAFYYIMKYGSNMFIIKYMLDNFDIDINQKFTNGETIFMYVCRSRFNINIIKFVLNLKGIDPNLQDDNGNTALILSIYSLINSMSFESDIIEFLLSNDKIDVNIKNNNGFTALSILIHCLGKNISCGISKPEVKSLVKILLKRNDIDVNIKNNNGETALDVLDPKGNKQIQQLLIKKK